MTAREQRRENAKQKEFLRQLTLEFFTKCMEKSDEQIKDLFKRHEGAWIGYVKKINMSNRPCFLYEDAFENAIKYEGHKRIKTSQVTNQVKLKMLRILQPIQNRPKLYFFVRDFFVWMKFILSEYSENRGLHKQ